MKKTEKDLFNPRQRYSIRKLSLGVFSIIVGTGFLTLSTTTSAQEETVETTGEVNSLASSEEESTNSNQLDTKVEESEVASQEPSQVTNEETQDFTQDDQNLTSETTVEEGTTVGDYSGITLTGQSDSSEVVVGEQVLSQFTLNVSNPSSIPEGSYLQIVVSDNEPIKDFVIGTGLTKTQVSENEYRIDLGELSGGSVY